MSFDRSERDKRMLARPTEAERTAGALERIADALERLVIEAASIRHSIATAQSLQSLRPSPLQPSPDSIQHVRDCPVEECPGKTYAQFFADQARGDQEPADPVLDRSIDDFAPFYVLSVRAYNCLRAAGVQTIRQLTEKTEPELLRIPGIGRRVSNEIMNLMKEQGLTLKNWRPTE
jgi:hypothetical protein